MTEISQRKKAAQKWLVIANSLFHMFGLDTSNNMLGVTQKSQQIKKSRGATKRTEDFGCCIKAVLMKLKHQDNSPATIAVGHCHTTALSSEGKMKICKKHQTFEVIG